MGKKIENKERSEKKSDSVRKGRSKFTALMLSLLSVIALMAALAAATFAWFTDTAVTKGSSVITGYMGAELMFDEATIKEHAWKYVSGLTPEEAGSELAEIIRKDINDWSSGDWALVMQRFMSDRGIEDTDKYNRKIKRGVDDQVEETYYRITDKDLNVITLENVEPGQAYPVHFFVANTGQLAFTFSSGFHIEKSYTGLQRLDSETVDIPESDNKFITDEYRKYQDNPAYITIRKVLLEAQSEKDPETGEPKIINENKTRLTEKYADRGGHLEDVLEVYIVPDGFYKDNQNRNKREAIVKENYIGTMAEIIGKPTESGTGKEGDLPAGNRAFTGYVLPKAAVTDADGVVVPQHVEIRDAEKVIRTEDGATELGELSFLIVAPETMEDEYQYASISISLGAYTTQVEYEQDGTGCTIYDVGAHVGPASPSEAEDEYCTVTFKGIDTSGNIYDFISANSTQKVKRGEKATEPVGNFTVLIDGKEVVKDRDSGIYYKDKSRGTNPEDHWDFDTDVVNEDMTLYVAVLQTGTL